jgi:phosphodiesterase/alkaline phosphatase D-like protein
VTLSGLTPGKTYYYRVRAENAGGKSANSNVIKVKTNAMLPTVSAPTAKSVTKAGAILGATILSNGGASITSAGVAYGTSADPTTSGSKMSSSDMSGAFAVTVTGLSSNTIYHFRGYAINSEGTSYTSDSTFTTKPGAPTAIPATDPSPTGFTANWTAPSGNATITGYRIDVSTTALFTTFVTGYKNLSVAGTTVTLTGLKPGKTYYYRVRAENAGGTSSKSNTISVKLPVGP